MKKIIDADHWRGAQLIERLELEYTRPSVLYKPKLMRDGDMWGVLYGDNLHEGIAGFGETPEKAMEEFDKNWKSKRSE